MNWGTKIILAFTAFVAVMATLVIKSYQTSTELVSPEYYKDEIEYQKVIDGSKNSADLSKSIQIKQSGRSIKLIFPGEQSPEQITGKVWLYCSYNSKKDLRFPLKLDSNGEIIYAADLLSPGQYKLKLSLDNKGSNYFVEKDISITP